MRNTCIVPGCSTVAHGQGRCQAHYYLAKPLYLRDCEICGKEFRTRRPETVTCSGPCTGKLSVQTRREIDPAYRRNRCSEDNCHRPSHGRGLCLMHLKRVLRHGTPEAERERRPVGMTVRDWFMAKVAVNTETGCWEWQGNIARKRHGYGTFYNSETKKKVYAHHFLVSPLPTREEAGAKMEYDHLCRNVVCVRPEHLEMVTAAENRGRQHRAK